MMRPFVKIVRRLVCSNGPFSIPISAVGYGSVSTGSNAPCQRSDVMYEKII